MKIENPISFLSTMKLYAVISIVIILFSYSCEYNPEGVNYHDVELLPPTADVIVLNENEINYLRGYVGISYKSLLDGHKFYSLEIYIDDEIVASSNDSGYITINSEEYEDGPHQLKFELLVSSKSGSLADVMEVERYLIRKEYDVYVFNSQIQPLPITEIIIENTQLKIKWTKYNQFIFRKYILYKDGSQLAEIENIDQTEFYDNTFVGGNAVYTLKVNVAGKDYEVGEREYNHLYRFLSSEVINQNSIKLTWERCPFDSGFSHYIVSVNGRDTIITGINQTTWTDVNPPFGAPRYYYKAIPKTGLPAEEMGQINAPCIGKYFHFYSDDTYFKYIAAKGWYLVYHGKDIIKYDANTLARLDSVRFDQLDFSTDKYSFDVSSDGNLIYLISDHDNAEIVKLDPNTLQVTNTYSLSSIIPGPSTHNLRAISISDNNIMVTLTGNQFNKIICIINMNTSTYIHGLEVNNASNHLCISNDGKHILHTGNLFKFENNTLSFVNTVSTDPNIHEYYPIFIDNNRIAHYNYGLQILSTQDLSVITTINVQAFSTVCHFSLDEITGYLGVGLSWNKYYIYDINSYVLKKTISTAGEGFGFQDKVFCGYNRYIPITFN
jgi:hypothetical protein